MTPSPAFWRWCALATRGVAPGARERLVRELEAHYLDALEAYRAAGCRAGRAEQLALRDLGDPRALRSVYLRTYPTEGQARRYAAIAAWTASGPARIRLIGAYAALMALGWAAGLVAPDVALGSALLAAALLWLLPAWLAARLGEVRATLALWALVVPWQAAAPLWSVWQLEGGVLLLNALAGLLVYALFLTWWLGPLWRKARFLAPRASSGSC